MLDTKVQALKNKYFMSGKVFAGMKMENKTYVSINFKE